MAMTAGEQGSRGAVFFIFLQILYDGQSTGFDITIFIKSRLRRQLCVLAQG
jgi:hypothetical protein